MRDTTRSHLLSRRFRLIASLSELRSAAKNEVLRIPGEPLHDLMGFVRPDTSCSRPLSGRFRLSVAGEEPSIAAIVATNN